MKLTQPWFVGATLRAISKHILNTTLTFSEHEVSAWDEALKGKAGMVALAMKRLLHHNMVEQCDPPANARRKFTKIDTRWRLTAKGLGTCRSVARALPDAPFPDPAALSTRVWELLRNRKVLTAEKAAEILIDANTRNFTGAQKQIAAYLLAWSRLVPDVVKVGIHRENGQKRYVMEKDGGIYPPPTKSKGIKPMPAPIAHAPVTSGTMERS